MKFISVVFSLLIPLCFNDHISEPHISDGIAKILYTSNQDLLYTKYGDYVQEKITMSSDLPKLSVPPDRL
jgi:hypothetical protein